MDAVNKIISYKENCECGAEPGELHNPGCDREICPECHDESRLIKCNCKGHHQAPYKGWKKIEKVWMPTDEERIHWSG